MHPALGPADWKVLGDICALLSEKAFLEKNTEIKKVFKINKHTHMKPEDLISWQRSMKKARDDARDA